jgi:putative membrane protein
MTQTRTFALLSSAALMLGLLVYSGLHAFDRATWAMEVFPVIVAMVVMVASYRQFPLTTLLYVCICVHAVVLIVGGIYTYARVPLGFQIADLLHVERNPYDKIGHFFQGLVPALVAREILIRGAHVNGRRMLGFVVVCIVLAISATYELIEWGAAEMLGQGADEFLGTQGYAWDTQSDMLMALIGACFALLLFARRHDRQIAAVQRQG